MAEGTALSAPDAIAIALRLFHSFAATGRTIVNAALPRYMRRNGLTPTKREHVTSYLDALRGWAAFIVINGHNKHTRKAWILNQPGLCLFRGGTAMVDVFFVISGYVLAYRMLKLMRMRQDTQLLDAVVSSVFRRYIRLYGSAAFASFIAMLVTAVGWGPPYLASSRKPTWAAQILDWFQDLLHSGNVLTEIKGYFYTGIFTNKYLDILWTIPVEFRGSMGVFLFCIGTCKLSNQNRMVLCASLIVAFYMWSAIYMALFLGGVLFADLSFSREPERLPASAFSPMENGEKVPYHQQLSSAKKISYSCLLFTGLILLAQPQGKDLKTSAWPWPFLESMTPSIYRGSHIQAHWYLSIGALFVVYALDCYPTLQAPLKWNISRYLGDLSFGIYVVHLPIVWSLTYLLEPVLYAYMGETSWSTHVVFTLVLWTLVMWAADLFIRVDDKVVAFGKWLQTRFFVW